MSKTLSDWEKQKSTYFCTVTHDLELAERMKSICLDMKYYAYIYHDPDTDDGTPHYHFIVRNNGTRSVKQMADKFGIPSNFIQPCKKVVAYRRYLLHLDNDDKIKYKLEDVHTNDIASMKSAIIGNDVKDIFSLYKDWERLRNGRLTPEEFIQENYVALQNMPFYQKIKTFETISKQHCKALMLT